MAARLRAVLQAVVEPVADRVAKIDCDHVLPHSQVVNRRKLLAVFERNQFFVSFCYCFAGELQLYSPSNAAICIAISDQFNLRAFFII